MGPILIVEDDAGIRAVMQQTLEEDGYDTIAAQDGDDALRVLEAVDPACILLDLNLPVIDGLGFLQEIHRRGSWPPVLIVSSDPRGHALGPADGVIGYVPKPFDLDDLVTAVGIATQAFRLPPVNLSDAWRPEQ
jgi:DNA-binding response OmpR family regulator